MTIHNVTNCYYVESVSKLNCLLLSTKHFTAASIKIETVKAWVHLNLSEEVIEELKLFLEHHQTVDIDARALQVVSGLFWCPSANFNFKF